MHVYDRAGSVEDAGGMVETVTDCLATIKETFESFLPAELFDGAMAPQMGKIVLSFYQVVSSFFNFNVKWPALLTKVLLMAENVNLSVLTIPGLSCIAMGTNYYMKLLGYTVGPLIILAMIVLPSLLATAVLSSEKRSTAPWKSRYDAAKASMMNNICYFLFIIYPTVSLTVLKGFHCRDFGPPHGSLLLADVQVVCPYGREDGDGFLFAWTLTFILAYPAGIPFFLYLVLRYYRIPEMAEQKVIQSCLCCMIQMYMEETCDVRLKKLANALWTEELVDRCFSLLCNEEQRIVIHDLKRVQSGDRNEQLKELLHKALQWLGVNKDLDWHAFQKVATDIIKHVNQAAKEFEGPVELETLTVQQMKLLLKHEFKADRGEIEAPSMLDTLAEEGQANDSTKDKEQLLADLEAGTSSQNIEATEDKKDAAKIDAETPATGPQSKSFGLEKKKRRLSRKEKQKLSTDGMVTDMDKEELRAELKHRVVGLYKSGVLVLPPLAWDGQSEEERQAVREIGKKLGNSAFKFVVTLNVPEALTFVNLYQECSFKPIGRKHGNLSYTKCFVNCS